MKIIKVSFSKWKKGKLPDEGNGRDFQPSATMENLIRRRNSSFSRVLNTLGQWVAEFHSNVTFAIQRVGQPLVTLENFLNVGEIVHFPRLELFTPVDTEDSRVPVLCDFL